MTDKRHKIDNTTGVLMMVVAFAFDLAQILFGLLHLIPIVGNAIAAMVNVLISLIAGLTLYLWFLIRGVNVFGGENINSKTVATFISVLVEIIPVIKLLPGWTFWTWRMIVISRIKEVTPSAKKGGRLRKIARKRIRQQRERGVDVVGKIGPAEEEYEQAT